MRRESDGQRDRRIGLRGTNDPVVILRVEAADERIPRRGVHEKHDARRLMIAAAVAAYQTDGEVVHCRGGDGRLVHGPVLREGKLIGGPCIRNPTHLGERGTELRRAERRRRWRT